MKSAPPVDKGLGLSGMSQAAIRNWRLLVLAAGGLIVVAWMAWQRIPRLEDPLIEPPSVFVTIPYPGASAEDVDTQVVKPVEEALFGMDGVDFVESKAYPNYALIVMRFVYGTAMDPVTEAVRGKVLGKRKQLPAEVGDPIVERTKMSTYTTGMVVAVAGHRADSVLNDEAKRLKDAIVTVPGVSTVTLRGARTRAVRVRLDPTRLAQHHLSVDDVTQAMRLANVRIPGGEVAVGSLLTLLAVNHEFKTAADVAQIPIGASADAAGGTHTISLGNVADVRDDFRTATERMLQDGAPAVGLEVRFRPGENAMTVGAHVRELLEGEKKHAPQGVALTVVHDQPEWVSGRLSTFLKSLVEGIVLVMLVITLGMGWRAAVVVAAVVPLSMAGAIFGLYVLGFSLEQISIAGLIVALGLLVDDAVVVTESIQLLRDRGLSSVRAAVLGTARVFWANNGTTAVACASFLPLFFMGGDTGSFIRGLPTAVVLALFTSVFVAQFLTPWISTFFLRSPTGTRAIPDSVPFDRQQDSAGAAHDERNVVLRAVKAGYTRIIPTIVTHPLKVIAVSIALLVGTFLLLPKVGIQFFPKADKPVLFVGVELPRGTDDSVTALKVAEVVAELRKDPAVTSTSAVVGASYPIVFMGRAPHPMSKDYGDVLVHLSTPSNDAIAQRLRARLASIPGVKATVEELYNGPPVPHPIMVRVQGDDDARLRAYAEEIKGRLRAIPGTLNVTDSLSDSVPIAAVDIDADRALRLGVTPGQVGAALRSLYGEDKVTSFRQEHGTVEVVLEVGGVAPGDNPLDRVGETPVPSVAGTKVPVVAIGDVSIKRSHAELRRRNTRKLVEISADVQGGTLPSAVLASLTPALDAMKWEGGYAYSFGGEQAETEKSFKNLAIAATITLLLVFVLLVSMFGSLTRAVLVLLAVPFAMIGAIGGLYLTGNPFGFMAFLGIIALLGVYVNHKIYFVDRMQELVARGVHWKNAMHQAGIDRLRPVILTAFTAILGLLPLTLGGGSFWASFGWVNIFGLATSIPLSLVLLPALLSLPYRFGKTTRAHAAEIDGTVVMYGRPLAPMARRGPPTRRDFDQDTTTIMAPPGRLMPGGPASPPSAPPSRPQRPSRPHRGSSH